VDDESVHLGGDKVRFSVFLLGLGGLGDAPALFSL